jgi:uncharacterized membrane protein SirB2
VGGALTRMALTIEGLLLMAVGTVGLLPEAKDESPWLPTNSLTCLALVVLGITVLGAAQRPGPRRVVAWVQVIGITARLIGIATGHPVDVSISGSALVGALLVGLALLSVRGRSGPSGPRG